MVKEMTITTTRENSEYSDKSQDLILTLNLSEEIIQFNKESERVTGYLREEVLHKKFSELLVPNESINQWTDLLGSIRQTMWIDNFILPLKTKDNQIHMITWTGFLVKDENGTIKDICIFGNPLKLELASKSPDKTSTTSAEPKKPEIQQDAHIKLSDDTLEGISKQHNREISMKHGAKKILFASEKKSIEKPIKTDEVEQFKKPSVTMEKPIEMTSEKLDLIQTSLKDLSQKYDKVIQRVMELEEKERLWEKKYRDSDKTQRFKEENVQSTKELKDTNRKTILSDEKHQEITKHTFLSDPFGFKRQHGELDLKKRQLEIRSRQLDTFKAQLTKELKIFNTRVEEFSRWQEKLMLLEAAIEKRRQELMKQENIVLSQGKSSIITEENDRIDKETSKNAEPSTSNYSDETFHKISQSAAIIQRGILKQINSPFLELLGYTREEILEKSYFDFIALEGLAEVEKYYLDRLKGDSVSTYTTIFSTKDDRKISVEVNIKQTIYNGEKAEIAVVTDLDSTKSQPVDQSVLTQ